MDKELKEDDLDVKVEQLEELGDAPAKEVDLEEKPKEKKEERSEKPQLDVNEVSKALKRMEYQARSLEKARREIEELKQNIVKLTPEQKEADEQVDPLDEIAQKDWKKAVRMLAQQELEERDKQIKERQAKESIVNDLEKSKQLVREKYPTIDDETSEEASLYLEVLNENPTISDSLPRT